MAFDVGDYFFKMNYTQLGYGAHVMTHSIDEWIDTSSTNNVGRIRTQDGGDVDAADGMEAFINKIKPFFTADVSFNSWTIYRQLLSTDIPTPVAAVLLTGFVGTNTTPGWHVATQKTITFRTKGFNLTKLSFLDTQTEDDWSKISAPPGSGALFDLITYVAGDSSFILGRDGTYPNLFLSSTVTLNEKLRRAAGLT